MAEDAQSRRRAFAANAPARRAALVAELAGLIASAPALTADEASVLRHLFAYAGFTEAGDLRIPALAPLWGEGASYVPAARFEPERVRAAVRLLVRRGVLRGVADEIALDAAAVRALPAAAAPLPPPPAPGPKPSASKRRARRPAKKRAPRRRP